MIKNGLNIKRMNKTIIFFLLGVLALLAIGRFGETKETVRFEEKIVSQDGTYVSHLNLYADSLPMLVEFAKPYDYGIRGSHIYIIVSDTNLTNYVHKKLTIIEIANTKFNIKPYVRR